MGILFSRAKMITNASIETIQEYTTEDQPALLPLIGITRFVYEGRAQKVSVPYTDTTGDMVNYKTVWQPIGQEGWNVKMQVTLRVHDDGEGSDLTDEIYNWQSVDTGQLLLVRNNDVNAQGIPDSNQAAYDRMPEQSLWFVDKITIASRKAVTEFADMELTLVRCWQV